MYAGCLSPRGLKSYYILLILLDLLYLIKFVTLFKWIFVWQYKILCLTLITFFNHYDFVKHKSSFVSFFSVIFLDHLLKNYEIWSLKKTNNNVVFKFIYFINSSNILWYECPSKLISNVNILKFVRNSRNSVIYIMLNLLEKLQLVINS